ncbi:hypothetical protein HDV06_005709 [Boothiomyces sp. JEL0866]|nr:hypothetical protein HDV06_005709 [Boothiomyces sp. JEL0866]
MPIILQSVWTSLQCQGIPDSLMLFNDSFGPPYYNWNPISFCGLTNLATADGDGCCVSSINLEYTFGFYSWLNTALDQDWAFATAAFASANDQSYCMIQSEEDLFSTNNSILSGVNAVLYRDTGDCIYGAKCTNSKVQIYNDLTCQSIAEEIPIYPDPNLVYPSTSLGNVTLSIYTFTKARNYIDWITLQPGAELVPDTKSVTGVFALFFASFAILISCLVFLYYCKLCYLGKKKMLMVALTFISFGRTVLAVVYTYVVFTDNYTVNVINLFMDCCKLIFLCFNILTCNMLHKILNFQSKKPLIVLYVLVTLAFIAMEAPLLYEGIIMLFPNLNQSVDLYNMIGLYVFYMNDIYTLFIFLFDSSPIAILLYKILFKQLQIQQQKDGKVNHKQIIRKYWLMLLVLSMQLLNGIIYITVNHEANNTFWLGNDEAVLSVSLFYLFVINWHNFGVIILYEYLRHFTWELVNPTSSLQPIKGQRMLLDEVRNTPVVVEQTIKIDKTIDVKRIPGKVIEDGIDSLQSEIANLKALVNQQRQLKQTLQQLSTGSSAALQMTSKSELVYSGLLKKAMECRSVLEDVKMQKEIDAHQISVISPYWEGDKFKWDFEAPLGFILNQ